MIYKNIDFDLLNLLRSKLESYNYDHYRFYPSQNLTGWLDYRLHLLSQKDNEYYYFIKDLNSILLFFSIRIPKWDEENFGFKLAFLEVIYIDSEITFNELVNSFKEIIDFLKSENVKFISARICSDNLQIIHALEELKFRYIENIIWPILNIKNLYFESVENIRVASVNDLERLKFIASNFQYQKGHYHCDKNFDIEKVNNLYAKWVETAIYNNDPVIVIEENNTILGYFVLMIDKNLSKFMGYKYGRMRSLALDSTFRGQGIGKKLFLGAIQWFMKNGVEIIDSGYASKNHISARLHNSFNMYSVYEEVTLHYWIK